MKKTAAIVSLILLFFLTSCNQQKGDLESSSAYSMYSSTVSEQSLQSEGVVSDTVIEEPQVQKIETQKGSAANNSTVTESASSSASIEVSSQPENKLTVSIRVTGLDGDIVFSSDTQEITDGISVYNLTEKICKENSINFKSKGSGYISAMGKYKEFEPTAGSGWLYKVDGLLASKSSAKYKLHGGEKIEWVFSTDYGKSLN